MLRLAAALSVFALSLPALADDIVAIVPIQGTLDDALRVQAEAALSEAAATFVPVQAAAKTQEHIDAGAALDIKCSGADAECWRRIRDLAAVDRLLVPVLGQGKLELLLVTRAASLDGSDEVVLGNQLAVGSARRVMARLLDVRAQLTVISNVNGAMVELDGKLVGQAPFRDPIEGLKAGEHKLRVYAAQHTEVKKTITLEPGEDAVIEVSLEAIPGSSGQGPLFWTGAGLVAAGGITAVTGGVVWVVGFSDDPAQPPPGADPSAIQAALEERQASQTTQAIGIGVAAAGAALIVTGTVLLVLTGDAE